MVTNVLSLLSLCAQHLWGGMLAGIWGVSGGIWLPQSLSWQPGVSLRRSCHGIFQEFSLEWLG